jgi:hypothetical protein
MISRRYILPGESKDSAQFTRKSARRNVLGGWNLNAIWTFQNSANSAHTDRLKFDHVTARLNSTN